MFSLVTCAGVTESKAFLQSNPFTLPEEDVFQLRNKQNRAKIQERKHQKQMKVHEKSTYLGKLQGKRTEFRRQLRKWENEADTSTSHPSLKTDPCWRKAAIHEQTDKDSIHAYMKKKRDMFFLEYSLAVKQEVITNLTEIAKAEENRLDRALQYLDEDAAMFDEFLKENDKSSVQAIKIAEQETKGKLEKMSEIKKITGKIVAVKSDISKFEDILKEYTNYNDFLLKLSPPEWREKQQWRREMADKIREEQKQQEAKGVQEQTAVAPSKRNIHPHYISLVNQPLVLHYLDPQLYFTDPQQLLDLLTELEKQNLNLIQNSQDTEEALEEFRITMINTRKKMSKETEQLAQHVEIISRAIDRERERAAELELKARLFSFGEYRADHQDRMLESLGKKVAEVYQGCVGETEANLTTLQMLTSIEGRLEELLENLELVPREQMLTVERVREKERRIRSREEKVRLQKKQQEERLRKALERAQADIRRPMGRKLMPRSQPPMQESHSHVVDEDNDVEKEKHQYFFT
ncbi:hypothetical protein ACEWY4_000754 [Coilia grayii]|uniref:DUF4200 domain-containing protein n=1 Tax=Coilia grayii TaxID=363190 RepID=A0ABD1KXJ7_9TELE